jgi:hypothetical protein
MNATRRADDLSLQFVAITRERKHLYIADIGVEPSVTSGTSTFDVLIGL